MKLRLFFFFILLLSVEYSFSQSTQYTKTLYPSMDNTLYEDDNGDTSNGDGKIMWAGRAISSYNSLLRGLLQFDLVSDLPFGAYIDSVKLTLVNGSGTHPDTFYITLHTVLSSWGEGDSKEPSTSGAHGDDADTGDATWQHRFYDTTYWANPGGDFLPNALDTGYVAKFLEKLNFQSIELDSLVRSWVIHPENNHGFLLKGKENQYYSYKGFYTRESSVSNRPKLLVYYRCTEAKFTSPSGCINTPIQFSGALCKDAVTYAWDFDNDGITDDTAANPTFTYNTSGIKPVTLITHGVYGCADTASNFAVVFSNPNVTYSYDTSCAGSYTTFTSNLSGTKFEWDFDNDNIYDSIVSSASVLHPFSTDGVKSVRFRIIDMNGCIGDTIQNIYVASKPTVNFISDSVCNNTFTTFKNLSNTPTSNNTYNWSFNNDSIYSDTSYNTVPITHAYTTGGVKQAKLLLITEYNCIDSIINDVRVYSTPEPKVIIDTVCLGVPSNIIDISTTPLGSLYQWDFDNDGVYDDFSNGNKTYTFNTNGTNILKLKIESPQGCIDSLITSAFTEKQIIANISADTACPQEATNFRDHSSTISGVNYKWDFNNDGTFDDNTIGNNMFTFTVGIHPVKLVIADGLGCIDSTTINIEVKPLPIISFTADSVCLGTATTFTDNSKAGNNAMYAWDFDNNDTIDDNTIGNNMFTYPAGNNYSCKLIVTTEFGCVDSIVNPINIKTKVPASFSLSQNDPDITLTNTSTGNITSFIWDFGDGITENTTQNPTHTYTDTDNYKICLTVTNECGDSTTCQSISIIGSFTSNIVLKGAFNISPNPFNNIITVTSHKNYLYHVKVTDLYGKVVYTEDNKIKDTVIDVSYLSKGIYFVTIETELGFITHKIIKSE